MTKKTNNIILKRWTMILVIASILGLAYEAGQLVSVHYSRLTQDQQEYNKYGETEYAKASVNIKANTIILDNSALPKVEPPVVETKSQEDTDVAKREMDEPSRGSARAVNMEVLATAYTPYDDGNSGTGLAQDGEPATPYRTISVDPDIIPLQSQVYVPGWGWGIAHDTGGAINGHHIDICVETSGQANNWGRKTVMIKVIPPR